MFRFMLFLVFSFNVYALDDSEIISTEDQNNGELLSVNYENINKLKTNYSSMEVMLDNYDDCVAKNKLYMGSGVAGADSDGCVDVKIGNGIKVSTKPIFAGFTSSTYGDNLIGGREQADVICDFDYSNSRAMTIKDFKYVYNDVLDGMIALSKFKIWVFDVYLSGHLGYTYNYSSNNVGNCINWTAGGSSNYGSIIKRVDTGYSNISAFLQYESCDSDKIFACVYN